MKSAGRGASDQEQSERIEKNRPARRFMAVTLSLGGTAWESVVDLNSDPAVTKHIFVTGGVVSSLGKGLTAASLGQPS